MKKDRSRCGQHVVAVLAAVVFAGAFAENAVAIPIAAEFVNSHGSDTLFNGHEGIASDPTTGKWYRKTYGGGTLSIFDSRADMEANNSSGTVTLAGGSFGTYFEVYDGKVFGRSDNTTSSIARWDATTGVLETTSSIASMGGFNGPHTFNWGGYSGVNFMADGDDLYLFGRNTDESAWQINLIDENLNVLGTDLLAKNALGYGFVINGTLFTGDSYSSTTINSALDLQTGVESAVDFSLTGFEITYLTNFDYDRVTDTLYVSDYDGAGRTQRDLFRVSNASVVFGVPLAVNVPEPGTLALFGLALIGLGLARRRRVA